MPEKTAAAHKAPAGIGDMEDVFAGKDATVTELADTAPHPAPGRPAAVAALVKPGAGAQPDAGEEREPLITTLRILGYLAENIRRWLYEKPTHSQHSMFFAGLTKLGIEVREEDLEPRRRPKSSQHR